MKTLHPIWKLYEYPHEDRETVLLIGGTGMQLTSWPIELCEELVRRGYCVIRYDNRDVGLSTKFGTGARSSTRAGQGSGGCNYGGRVPVNRQQDGEVSVLAT